MFSLKIYMCNDEKKALSFASTLLPVAIATAVEVYGGNFRNWIAEVTSAVHDRGYHEIYSRYHDSFVYSVVER